MMRCNDYISNRFSVDDVSRCNLVLVFRMRNVSCFRGCMNIVIAILI